VVSPPRLHFPHEITWRNPKLLASSYPKTFDPYGQADNDRVFIKTREHTCRKNSPSLPAVRKPKPSASTNGWELVYSTVLGKVGKKRKGNRRKPKEHVKEGRAHGLMPNNQIKTNQAEVTATAAQQVASDLPGVFRLRIEDGFFFGHSENGFKLLPDCLSSWPTLVALFLLFSRRWLKFNQALKFLHVRISISISIIFNGRSNFWLLVTCATLCPLWSQWVLSSSSSSRSSFPWRRVSHAIISGKLWFKET